MLKRMGAGVIMVALGLLIAVIGPKLLPQPTSEPVLDRRHWEAARLGDEFIIHGRAHSKKAYDKGILIGQKHVWTTDSDGKTGWTHADEYRQAFNIHVRGFGYVDVDLDSTDITGEPFVEEQPEKERYVGVKMKQRVVTRVAITELSPRKARQLAGETLFVGTLDEWQAARQKKQKMKTYIFWLVGGLIATGGAVTFVMAPKRKKA